MKALDSYSVLAPVTSSAMELSMYSESFTHTMSYHTGLELCMYSEGFGFIQCPATPYRTSQCIELCMYSEGFGFLAKVSDSYNAPGLASVMDVMELCKHSKLRL